MAVKTTAISDSQRSAAKIAALAFPISIAFLAYANFGVRGPLFATADSAERVRLIAGAESLYRLSVVFDLVYCTGFLVLLTALYATLSPVNRYVALLASVSKLLYTVTAMLMALSFLSVVNLASNPTICETLGRSDFTPWSSSTLWRRGTNTMSGWYSGRCRRLYSGGCGSSRATYLPRLHFSAWPRPPGAWVVPSPISSTQASPAW